ncbi:MAG: aldo/keto reductase [Acholeplasmatales bacterium]|nr:aldo/keto reductase [Acholeplasmatales bacterium]
MEYFKHRNINIPLIGLGSWGLGENEALMESEIETGKYAIINHGMTLIDTAEMYGDGRSEKIVAKMIDGIDRDKLFIVGKILPENAQNGQYIKSCKQSLANIGIDYFDLYLLHWKSSVNLGDMVKNMEKLKSLGLIKNWGVSNFDVTEMEELFQIEND